MTSPCTDGCIHAAVNRATIKAWICIDGVLVAHSLTVCMARIRTHGWKATVCIEHGQRRGYAGIGWGEDTHAWAEGNSMYREWAEARIRMHGRKATRAWAEARIHMHERKAMVCIERGLRRGYEARICTHGWKAMAWVEGNGMDGEWAEARICTHGWKARQPSKGHDLGPVQARESPKRAEPKPSMGHDLGPAEAPESQKRAGQQSVLGLGWMHPPPWAHPYRWSWLKEKSHHSMKPVPSGLIGARHNRTPD
ncbi:hypothetical protein FB451DRAFT_1189694 [Mycena latifolia]|nr:hypothetical protein FB451DRAFT_1189694 [Mycena latifolia]